MNSGNWYLFWSVMMMGFSGYGLGAAISYLRDDQPLGYVYLFLGLWMLFAAIRDWKRYHQLN